MHGFFYETLLKTCHAAIRFKSFMECQTHATINFKSLTLVEFENIT